MNRKRGAGEALLAVVAALALCPRSAPASSARAELEAAAGSSLSRPGSFESAWRSAAAPFDGSGAPAVGAATHIARRPPALTAREGGRPERRQKRARRSNREFDGDLFLDGFGGVYWGGLFGAWGLLVLAHPIGALAVGSLFALCGVGMAFDAKLNDRRSSWLGSAFFLGLAALTLAAPPLGALGIFAAGAAIVGVGLVTMAAAFFQKRSMRRRLKE